MRLPFLAHLVMATGLALSLQADAPAGMPRFAALQAWAGPDAEDLGFTQEKLNHFLTDRMENLSAARLPEWSGWLKGLERSKSPNLKAWALTRQVEAGDYGSFAALQNAINEHLLGISKLGNARDDRIITTPPTSVVAGMPDALHIDHRSVFWRSPRKSLQETPEHKLTPGLYSIWCYGTHPDQKDLIFELAAQVGTTVTVRNPDKDPWNDPRF